jgi:tartrate dehydratase beta subunit/fumarate hydratase class I family protein
VRKGSAYRTEVVDFPAFFLLDDEGNDLYESPKR